jgi:signal transduction histidine kinase
VEELGAMSLDIAIEPANTRAAGPPLSRLVLLGGLYVAILVAATVYPLVSPLRDDWDALPLQEVVGNALVAAAWLPVLLISYARQPHGRLWKLIFLATVTARIDAVEYIPNSFVWSAARASEAIGLAFFGHLLVAYPSGHLRDRFDRAVVAYGYLLIFVWTLKEFLLTGDWWALGCDPECIRNVFVVWPNGDLYDGLRDALTVVATATLFPLVIVAVWRHWHGATSAARRTLLPLIVGLPIFLAASTSEILSRELDFEPGVRFFDSAPGAVVRAGAPLIFPIGILLVVVTARYGRARVAELVVELGRGVPVGGLRDVLAKAIGDPTLQLAFTAPGGEGFVDSSGRPVEIPAADPTRMVTRLERGGEVLGVLVHEPQIEAEDAGLVEAVGNAARLALENERLAAQVRAQLEEVRASRLRIVEAADAERRRVERDLHDGAQQRLVALALRLQVAKAATPGAAALLDEATAELQSAIGEVRGLARGVHPTILTEAGLRAAIEALADRAPLPVTVDVIDRRYDPRVEATAYFVVAEALTNVARHASATEARVSLAEEGGHLVVSVGDDGVGGADAGAGSGLLGLRDRLSAMDGRLMVDSPVAHGTTVIAEIPLEPASPVIATETELPASRPASVRAVRDAPIPPSGRALARLSHPAILIAVLAASIGAVAMMAWLATVQPRPPVIGRANSFLRPFDYQVPGDREFKVEAQSARLYVVWTSREGGGISVWAVDDVLADPCAWEKAGPPETVQAREAGVGGLLAYLRSVSHLAVQDAGTVTIDGRPAVRADLSIDGLVTGCPENNSLLLWRDDGPGKGTPIQVWPESHKEISILDVDGQTIVIEVWSGDDVDRWLPTARDIVDSIRFLNRPLTKAPSPGQSVSP